MFATVENTISHSSQDWGAILPEFSLGLLVLIVLGYAMYKPTDARGTAWLAMGGLALLVVGYVIAFARTGIPHYGETSFGGLLLHTTFSQWMRLFFPVVSLGICAMGIIFLGRRQLPKTEFYVLVLTITGALMLMAQSNNFLMLFIALETVTIGFYILVGFYRHKSFSLEAALKFLILGALSSAILLAGIVLLYGAAGNPELAGRATAPLDYDQLAVFLAANPDMILAQVGVVLVLCGIAFKIGAVPFQIWIPDVYQGAPSPTTAFLSVSSKAGGFAILIALVIGPFRAVESLVIPILSVFAILSILFGNLTALNQTNVKRLMGLSGISHAGFLLMGVIALVSLPAQENLALAGIFFYIVAYALSSLAVFGVILWRTDADDAHLEIADFAGLAKQHPLLGLVLLFGLGSLAGIPPMAGFIGKMWLFYLAFQAGAFAVLFVAVLGVVLSIYYYFGWIRTAWFPRDGDVPETGEVRPASEDLPLPFQTLIGIYAGLSLILGFLPLILVYWLLPGLTMST